MTSLTWSQADIGQCVDQVLRSRRSVRAYKPEPLAREQVLEILQAAASAPSNSNTQPWRVYVVTGAPMRRLGDALVTAFQDGSFPPPTHFPDPLPAVFCDRQADFAARYYGTLGIDRKDAEARARQSLRNFTFFGAPVGLIFSIDARLGRHSWLDLGLYVQNVMIAARSRGIDTCPQVSFARFHSLIAAHLGMPDEEVTACGMSMGFGDTSAGVNQMNLPRQHVSEFVRLAGFEAPAEWIGRG
ncbi:nitroreductase family protein [Ramlibacter alkalitolerans]|uniref:Nitroreductase family protein n=1 Tax=Ramlibacter alkalitolerans TaxID=2039631 RepID=A0ABS1JTL3_9BURK|nr:nitroreductase family protein [Ramlibacter alkalitolerans]MBL0427506.1 nitroreductase family protein [Ramlibacter alkalitolerans]